MAVQTQWLHDVVSSRIPKVDGLVRVQNHKKSALEPEEVAVMEKAEAYGADAVFFEAGREGQPSVAQAFVFLANNVADDEAFAEKHRQIWSWGGVPLLYRAKPGLVQLFRCAHKPDFLASDGKQICSPIETLKLGAKISETQTSDPWWDAGRLRNGTLWDDPVACGKLLRHDKAAHKSLFDAIRSLFEDLSEENLIADSLMRRLLELSLLIAYLEEREVFEPDFFRQFKRGATRFFEVLPDAKALTKLLAHLEDRFNGQVFQLDDKDRKNLQNATKLKRIADIIEGREAQGGQRTLWQLYSFKDLPIELISSIYQLFVKDKSSSVYTPPFLVRLMLDEALSWERLNRLEENEEIILDPCCGSGVFLVEAYKRLVLHWRSRNGWKKPRTRVLKGLLQRVHGIDQDPGPVHLAAFSLCLALCDSLEPQVIRKSVRLFPPLVGRTLHHSCFFEAKEKGRVPQRIGVIVGNPPFESELTTEGAKWRYKRYRDEHGTDVPDNQLAYLFLHEAMDSLADGGLLCMLQPYGFLYNQSSKAFRRDFFTEWDVREVLDFISVRGLFDTRADTKVIVLTAEAKSPSPDREVLHAIFRRSGRTAAQQGFEIDYYDLHWVPYNQALEEKGIWRANLLGGGRVLELVKRLRRFRTLKQFTMTEQWDVGEGFIAAKRGTRVPAGHLTGKRLVEPKHLRGGDLGVESLGRVEETLFKSPYTPRRFQAPMLLVHEHEDLAVRCFFRGEYAYKDKIVGFCPPRSRSSDLQQVYEWINNQRTVLQAYLAAGGTTSFTQRASWVGMHDILALPYPESRDLDLSQNERIIAEDIVHYYRDLVRLGAGSRAMKEDGSQSIGKFNEVLARQVNAIYRRNPLRALECQIWPGVICQPFAFGAGEVDWTGAEELRDKLDALLKEQKGSSLFITRIARIYDGDFIFLLKPDRLRFWLRSIALRDADEILADLRDRGF